MTILLFVSFMHRALHFLTRLRKSTNRNRSSRNISRITRTETSRDNFSEIIFQILYSKRFFFLFKTRLKEKFKYNSEDGDFRSMDERLLEILFQSAFSFISILLLILKIL